MACRKVLSEKHLTAAKLLLDGWSGYKALRAAGYSHWSSRNFGAVLRRCWSLREAIQREEERRLHHLTPRPARRKRYDRRPIASVVRQYVAPYLQEATTNTFLHKLYKDGKRLQALTEDRASVPLMCSVCRGPLEGDDHWCVRCQRIENLT